MAIRKIKKIVFRFFIGLLLLLLLLAIGLSIPSVQTYLGKKATEKLNKDFGTDITVEQVNITFFGSVKLKNIVIKDHHQDTLFYIKRLKTSIFDIRNWYEGNLIFKDVTLYNFYTHIITYPNEKESNLDLFIAAFDDGKPSSGKFLMKAKSIEVKNSIFYVSDYNKEISKEAAFSKVNAKLQNFKIKGPNVYTTINNLSFLDYRGLFLETLTSEFTYTKKNILLEELELKTSHSKFLGAVKLSYNREDFASFNDKVIFDITIDKSKISSSDIFCFYKDIDKNLDFDVKGNFIGTLNSLKAQNMQIKFAKNTFIMGDFYFKNTFGKAHQKFFMGSTLNKFTSNFEELYAIIPKNLDKKLPQAIKKLGIFQIEGFTELSKDKLLSDVYLSSSLGDLDIDVEIDNYQNAPKAKYFGTLVLQNFDVGNLIENKLLGKVKSSLDIEGSSFDEKTLNTRVNGIISSLNYNNYTYQNIDVNGTYKTPVYSGEINVNDPNLFLDFEGVVDLNPKRNLFNLSAKVDYANLKKLNFVTNNETAIFKGYINTQLTGTNIDDLAGDVQITRASYQNNKDLYILDDFSITSSFDEQRERKLTINSPDIVDGAIVGKFKFNQLRKMLENSFGSLYTNYQPNKIAKGQYLNFNFSIYNKILEIFYPEIIISQNTKINGSINSDNDEFKLDFNSKEVTFFNNTCHNLNLEIDNKNPLYTAFIEIDSIKNKYYSVSDLNLINVTSKDTLFFRTEFKGGKKKQDFYNLNVYHTIDKNKNNVVGILKSELQFKDYLWYLNEINEADNKIVFDKDLKSFVFENIKMTHQEQIINLLGQIKGNDFKDLDLFFSNVNIGKILPIGEELNIDGTLNGGINFKQRGQQYQPTSELTIDDLKVNKINFGNLLIDIEGDNTFKKFKVASILENDKVESFKLDGNFQIENKETVMDLTLKLEDFNIGAFSSFGGEAFSNIRGLVSGNTNFEGTFTEPEINGRLFLENAGLTIPYLNVDYQLKDNSVVDVTEKQFLFRNIVLTDTKFNTRGLLEGNVRHDKLSNWRMDLDITSSYFNVLNTDYSEDAVYYGKAFIDGNANVSGPLNALKIEVNATSKKGTDIKIPISDNSNISDNKYIKFINPLDKISQSINEKTRDYDGLELDFDFTVTEDATMEVILDKETNHAMKGTGFGRISMQINTLGKFNMFGEYQVYDGEYNFNYRGLFNKKFKVKRLGTINWEGDPFRARLNLEATYAAMANPAVLLDNPTVNRKVPVEVAIGLTGNLSSPEPDFNINFPTVSSVLQSEIQTKLGDKEMRQTQALYLLASGGFMSPEGAISQNALTNNVFETASGILGDILQDGEGVITLTPELTTADRTPGRESDGQIGFSGNVRVNDRISINGRFGVPYGGINDAAVLGDIEIQYRVNEDGTLNFRAFNKENDISYVGESIGYTQGLGLTYKVNFDTFKEFLQKLLTNRKYKKENPSLFKVSDSDMEAEFIQFVEEKNKAKKQNSKQEPKPEPIPELD